jgi:hypothetical protein
MAQPTAGDVHVNQLLTQISIAYIQDPNNFIADSVFPNIPVQKQSDRYTTYDRSYWFRSEAKERAPGTESAGSGYAVDTTPTYFATLYAFHKDIDDPTRANADDPIDMDRDGTSFVTQQLMMKRELTWSSKYFGSGIWGAGVDADQTGVGATPSANQFLQFTVAGSLPVETIDAQIANIAQLTGYKPNILVMGPQVFQVLKNHTEILDRIKYTQRGIVTAELMAEVFGVDQVLVPWAVQNTGAEGAAASYSFIYGKSILLLYSNPRPSILTPSAGYTFSWTGLYGNGAYGNRIKKFRMEAIESDRVEGEMAYDQKLIAPELGVFFGSCIA